MGKLAQGIMARYRKVFAVHIWCMVLLFLWSFGSLSRVFAEPMDVKVDGVEVRMLLTSIAKVGGFDLVLDDSVTGKVSIHLTQKEPEEILELIAMTKGLVVERRGSTYLVRAQDGNVSTLYRTHVFPIQYAEPDSLLEVINLSLGEAGFLKNLEKGEKGEDTHLSDSLPIRDRLLVHRGTNTLILYGTEEDARITKGLLDTLDVPVEQVALEAKVVALTKAASKELGIDWSWSEFPIYPYTVDYDTVTRRVEVSPGTYETQRTRVPVARSNRQGIHGAGTIPGVITFGHGPEGYPFEFYYGAKLSALITDGKAQILARPNITTVQGKEAVINIGGKVPVKVSETTNSTVKNSITYKDAGIILRYTPRVNADGYITATVHTEVSSPVYVAEMEAYRFDERTADTTVRLKSGETMVIGGLIGSEETRALSKIPFLGDLPLLGALFRSEKKNKQDSEIMIFLTARIIGREE